MIKTTAKQATFQGYDEDKITEFYQAQFKQAKKQGYTDVRADDLAKYMVDYYKHQFRSYQ